MGKYYLLKGKKRQGPFTEEELIKKGLTPDSTVKRKDAPKWKKASEVPALAKYFPPPLPYQQNPNEQQYNQSYYQQNDDNQFCGKRPKLSFGEARSICFEKYSDFSGRARRSEFWWFVLVMILSFFVFPIIPFIVPLYCMIPMLAVTVRRLHDINISGGWCFSFLLFFLIFIATCFYDYFGGSKSIVKMILDVNDYITAAFGVIMLVLCCLDSNKHENKYGPSPKYQ